MTNGGQKPALQLLEAKIWFFTSAGLVGHFIVCSSYLMTMHFDLDYLLKLKLD